MRRERSVLSGALSAVLITAATVVAALLVSCAPPVSPSAGTGVGSVASDFTLVDQNGVEVSLSEFEGKVILLNFSTMWCKYCRQEAKDIARLYDANKDRGLAVITVLAANAQDGPIAESDCRQWARLYKSSFPVLADIDRSVSRRYNKSGGWPLNLIIDRNMVIRDKVPGYGKSRIESAVAGLLNR
jgi:peroxiredoxin